jgi:hypothetical protein
MTEKDINQRIKALRKEIIKLSLQETRLNHESDDYYEQISEIKSMKEEFDEEISLLTLELSELEVKY